MNRFLKVFAIAAAGFAIALLAPDSAWAACPGNVPFSSCGSGGSVNLAPGTNAVGGAFWVVGAGNDLTGPGDTSPGFGTDAGGLAVFPLTLSATGGESWLTDFVSTDASNGYMCIVWDWASSGSDGCASPIGNVMAVVVRDNLGNWSMLQVAGDGIGAFDLDTINNGVTSFFGVPGNGMVPQKAVTVTSSSDLGSTVGVTVAPLSLAGALYDEQSGARPLPGTPRLRGRQANASVVLENDGTGGSFNVDADSDVCWELVDGAYSVTLGCRSIGGNTPSQNVVNGKAGFAKGGASFTWDVTAQFDVLGFNIYQKNTSKNTDRKINDALIGLSGDNDATAESYKYLAPRSDLRAWKGGFEIELVRSNGETSRAPVTIAK